MNWKKVIISSFCSMLLLLVTTILVYGQLGTTGINGQVRNQANESIRGASIKATNKDTSQTFETTSREDGSFVIFNLQPGVYSITVEADGYDKKSLDNTTVLVGNVVTIIADLPLAKTKDVVEIIADRAKPVNLTTSAISGVINKSAVENLPLNGRNFIDLALLLPGTAPNVIFDTVKISTRQISTVGQTSRSGNVSVDGADNNDDLLGVTLQNFPIDSVQEFQISQAGFAAEFGRGTGGIVTVVTKTGGNEYHGSGAFFFRNNRLSALLPTLDRGVVSRLGDPPFDRQQYALNLGGPIKKDKAWFFSSYEYRFQDAISIVGLRDTAARQIIQTFAPTPLRNPLFLARVDAQVSAKDRMSFRFALERIRNTTPPLGLAGLQTANSLITGFDRYYSGVYNWIHTFSPNLVNDFTFHANNASNNFPSTNTTPQLTFPSIQDGNTTAVPTAVNQKREQFRNNVSLLAGNHTLKFGGEFHQVNSDFLIDTQRNGLILLAENFATMDRNRDGRIDDFDIPITETDRSFGFPSINTSNQYFSAFIQDSWKVRRNFTINLGLRYEVDTNITNRKDFDKIPAALQSFGRPKIDKNNFAPRIGFNWDPFSDGRTSIRGSYGIFYNRNLLSFPNNAASNQVTDSVFEIREGSFLDDDGFFLPNDPTLANPFIGALIPEGNAPTTVDPNLATPYVQQFTLGVEREIVRDLVLSVEGIHTFGVKFPQIRFTPDFGDSGAFVAISTLKNWYDGLFVKLEKRPGSSFYSFIGSYTFSKALNLSNDDLVTEFNPRATQQVRKGPAINDIRHRFTMSGLVNMPLGFKMSSILTVESAIPISIFVANAGALPFVQRGAGARQFDTGAELNDFIRQLNTARPVPIPLVRDDVKLGNNFVSMDVRLAKEFKVSEKLRVQGIAEVFNVFNKTNVRGGSGSNFPGIDNVIVRDSFNRNDPGFLRSSNFGAVRQTAGGVFGTGGPRALQLAVRVQF